MDSKLRAQSLIEFGLPRNWIAMVVEKLSRGGTSSLTSNELYMIFKRAGSLFRVEPSLLDVRTECRVVGNLYGRVDSLKAIFRRFGWPSEVCYVFLGDYIVADGDQIKMDVFMLLLIFKIVYPRRILLLRGSAECEHCAADIGVLDLLYTSFTVSIYQVLTDIFKYLPLAAQVSSVYLLSNTSLTMSWSTLKDLELVVRPCTTCPKNIRSLILLTLQRSTDSQPDEDEEPSGTNNGIPGSPVAKFMKKSGLLISVRDAGSEVPERCGCEMEVNENSALISVVSATVVKGARFNGTVLAIHPNRACTFHSIDPRLEKPLVRLLMPQPKQQ